jgi:hypothetical protein
MSDLEDQSSGAVEGSTSPASSPPPIDAAAIVRAWFARHLLNSPLSRATEAFNHVQAALPALITALEKKD